MAISFEELTKRARVVNRGRTSSPRKHAYQLNATLTLNDRQHDVLLQHLLARLLHAKAARDTYINTFRYIDREYNGYLKRDADDARRHRDNLRGVGLKPVDAKLALLFAQIDEAITFLLSVLAPDDAIYTAQAPRVHQDMAKGVTALMNSHAETFHHYRNLSLFLLDCMRYNLGSFGVHWREIMGNILASGLGGAVELRRDMVASGNELVSYDPYNVLVDPSVNIVDVPEQGEYAAVVELVTEYKLARMEADGELYGVDRLVAGGNGGQTTFYEAREFSREQGLTQRAGNAPNWVSLLSYGAQKEVAAGYELVTVYAWVVPLRFGLGTSKHFEIWRFTIANGHCIMHGEPLDNAHAMLPVNFAQPFEDHAGMGSLGAAERLVPHQTFASYVLNTHQRAVRKKLFGLTFYDKNAIPLMESDDVDMQGGKIPVNSTGVDMDIRKKVVQFTDGPDTTGTLENLAVMRDLMQQILPTSIQNQVAGLDRATQYQAAAVVQGANKRNLKIAKIVNAQAMNRSRHMQYYNILQYQKALTILDAKGEPIEIDPAALRGTKIEFTIADGLKGLDRLALQLNMKEMFNSLLQSKQAIDQTDVMALFDYITSMMGDHTDFKQFKLQSPIDALPAEQRNIAFQLLQQYLAQMQEQQQQGGAPAQPGGLPLLGGPA